MNADPPPLQPGLAADPEKWLDPFAWRNPSLPVTQHGKWGAFPLAISTPLTHGYPGSSASYRVHPLILGIPLLLFPCLLSFCHGAGWVAMRFTKDHVRVFLLPLPCG